MRKYAAVDSVYTLIKLLKEFKSKCLSILRRAGKKEPIIGIARLLSQTTFIIVKNINRFINIRFNSLNETK